MGLGTNIPIKLYEVLIPILVKALDDMSNKISDIALKALLKQIESTIDGAKPCNDIELQNIADQITQLKRRLDKFLNQLNKINTIVPVLQTISVAANGISTALTIAATPFAPGGAVKALQIISLVSVNAASVAKLISSILSQIALQLNSSIDMLNTAISAVNSACPSNNLRSYPSANIAVNDISSDGNDTSNSSDIGTGNGNGNGIGTGNGTGTGIGNGISNINDFIPDSIFYRDVNVSDDDLNDRIDTYISVLSRQANALNSIKEAPSNIVTGNQNPNANDGNIGDYFINNMTGQIFGPKSPDGQWN